MQRKTWQIVLVLAVFILVLLKINSSSGTDQTGAYVGCRLIRAGEVSHLYAHDPVSFNQVSDPMWGQIAAATGIPASTVISPFVQTPLWPWVLQPLCGSMNFSAFNMVFEVIGAVCFAVLIWLTGRYWTTRFFTPPWVLLMAILWVRADPLREATELTQTHVIFFLLSLLAILLARKESPGWAGVLLAIAAAVKITPGIIVIYWVLTKQRKAALSFVLASLALFGSTILLVGRAATTDYIHSMARVSNVLLLSGGNQSFAAWLMGHIYPKAEGLTFQSLPLPATLKILCLALIVLSAVVGAYFDRKFEAQAEERTAPYGAIFTLLGATIFTPIAWSHYYLILVVPLILLLDDQLRRRSVPLLCLFGFIVVFANSPNLIRHAGYLHLPVPDLVRGEFYAGVVAMGAVFLLYRRHREEALKEGIG